MKQGIKIVTIGGGSSYTPELIEGFIKRYDELPIRELWLVDIEEGKEKLHIVGNLAKRMVEKAGIPMEIHLTLNRREALKDADFVTTQFRVGLLDARIKDERIPAKYNMLGQETNGAGGVFKALRTVPVIYDIIKDMKELCEHAWLINFTNPAGVVSEAVFRYCDFERYIGVCNVPINMTMHFADQLSVKPKDLVPIFGGLNHLSFVLNVFHRKKDRLPEIMEKMRENQMTMNNIDPLAWSHQFVKELKCYPSPYLKYYYFYEEMFKKFMASYEKHETRAELVKDIETKLFKKYEDLELKEKPEELSKRGGAYYSDVACSVISSIYNDKRDYQVVNTINNGHITDLPDGCAIEITCRITKDGPIPVHIGQLPVQIRGLVQSVKAYEELLADAIYEKNLDKALLALQIHPLTKSTIEAKKAFDELVIAHKPYLTYYEEK
ncbi:MAG: 6-phospho-beta-glucosidase [Tenericutes bacterium GWC2_34_14]|nr:MAG: 6-phospho-beta-glucosidase [Tenericutes bacterium GWA2_35_7]OHE28777.1 MAG: 6-phospho-beta-glucosidase [Tenericutes bacterium GWC2_34_14]OHE33245.1 MAG: 6-phospho-beta-glucosidase [Tenericutes bacterium GWE2_34_108]OHE36395.1 MAG: 6-phospho-beta-glucosidase [Tenericutes bacterium GWF1_35_14]OHE37599.1 MAG: 6-phospho-beta-glucosidase [Tenericutes bacterium GWF2_35_184]OHE45124.1 MAG: 6-phospho-beta-glucosidase [Tenericutes bacterium RIFOXYA2_FULL_36_32]OHE47149.1 MAG: 6-phospho-beta-gl